MASPYEIQVTISSAKDLKNVNWRHGELKPYAVLWVDPNAKCSTRVDEEGDTCPIWDEKMRIPLKDRPEEATLYVDIVHADAGEDTKPLIGSASVSVKEILDDVGGFGQRFSRTVKLKRPSGRPQGKLDVEIVVVQRGYQPPPEPYAQPYGQQSRGYGYGYGNTGAPPQQTGYPYAAPHEYAPYPSGGYGAGQYQAVGGAGAGTPEKGKSNYGMGTGLAIGAAAGVLGGVALAEGVDYVEGEIADDVADKVEDDLGYDDDGGFGD